MRGGNHMDNQLPELKVNMLGRFSITYGEQPITFKRNSATKAVKLLQILLHSSLVEDRGSTGIPRAQLLDDLFGREELANVGMKYFDLVMPSVALAQGFGRIGCFLAGCCYGKETNSAFHIIFHDSAYAPNNVPLIPTQLISSGLDFLNCIFLMWFAGKKKGDGQVAGLYLVCYSVGRFVLEFFRGDLERGNVGSLSTSQFIAIFTAIAGVVLFFWFGKKKAQGPEKNIQEEKVV